MIRDRIKDLARKAAVRAFGMDRDMLPHEQPNVKPSTPTPYDPSVIPRVVDGSGDTPGPNHKEDIGRTWLAAQVISAVPPMLIDLRPPDEVVAGMLPRAVVMPGWQVRERLAELPEDRGLRVVVYDQTGGDHGTEVAAWLRAQGWGMARRLAGGFAEWIEHDEPTARPEPPAGGRYHVGMPVQLKGGRRGFVLSAKAEGGAPVYTVWFGDGTRSGPLSEAELGG